MGNDATGPLREVIRTMVRIAESPLPDHEKLCRLRMQLGAAVVLLEGMESEVNRPANADGDAATRRGPHWSGHKSPRR